MVLHFAINPRIERSTHGNRRGYRGDSKDKMIDSSWYKTSHRQRTPNSDAQMSRIDDSPMHRYRRPPYFGVNISRGGRSTRRTTSRSRSRRRGNANRNQHGANKRSRSLSKKRIQERSRHGTTHQTRPISQRRGTRRSHRSTRTRTQSAGRKMSEKRTHLGTRTQSRRRKSEGGRNSAR